MRDPSTSSLAATLVALVLCTVIAAPAAAQVCGDGIAEAPEECDDGALFRLDGCTPGCTYEHVQRLTHLEILGGPAPAFCTPPTNAFGAAFTGIGLTGINAQLATGISDGTLNQLLQILALDDPAGVADPEIEVGFLGSVLDPRGQATGLDGWYLAGDGFLDADHLPAVRLSGAIAARELAAGPGVIEIRFLGGLVKVRDARIAGIVGSTTSLPGPPPDEFVPGFAAFEGIQATDGSHGLCGNLTVGSLAIMPLPAEFTSGGAAACSGACAGSRSYTWCGDGNPVGPGCNSVLDLLVSGCAVTPPLCLALLQPTQPDAGAGGQPPVVLVPDPTTGKVTVVEPEDAYSTWFGFTAERIHITNHLGGIFADGFESGDPSRWTGTD